MNTHTKHQVEALKTRGAFYTDAEVAEFLVWWAVRSPRTTVMDPSFGEGVFLQAACKRMEELGGNPSEQVFGVEIDASAHQSVAHELPVRGSNLILCDFFDVDPNAERRVDAVIGNPPFIRYHRFKGVARETALGRAAREGVRLNGLTSSWAPFLVHSVAMLKVGGRLAMVLPMEIGHAAYARPLLDFLSASFRRITFLTFRKALFPKLNEDTLLLLAEERGGEFSGFFLRDLGDAHSLAEIRSGGLSSPLRALQMNAEATIRGEQRLIEYLVPRRARELYQTLKKQGAARTLGELADVGIGYVTGDNSFFHLSAEEAKRTGMPAAFLRPAILKGRSLAGLRFTRSDWKTAMESGAAGLLLSVNGEEAGLPKAVQDYLEYGEGLGVPRAFKCRTRSPWYRVPNVHVGDAFLSYMSGVTPLLAVNDARAVATNSLHVVRLHALTRLTAPAIAALWQTSLTRLSAEIEGHALGGGMLKLEPTEAENVLLPSSSPGNPEMEELAGQLDLLIRRGQRDDAQTLADDVLLRDSMGLDARDLRLLRKAADQLRTRRYSRGGRT